MAFNSNLNYMKKVGLVFAVLLALGLAVSAKAVISDEFGGAKKDQSVQQQEKEESKNRNQNMIEATATVTPEREMERKENGNEKPRDFVTKPRLETVGTTTEVVVDEGANVPLRILAEGVSFQGNKLLVTSSTTGSTTEYRMKTALPAFVNQLTKTWRKEGATTTIESFEIKVEDDKPVYEVSLTETGKLFGLIPLKLHRTAVISTETEEVKEVKQPWYSFLVRKLNLSKLQAEEGSDNATTTDETATTT